MKVSPTHPDSPGVPRRVEAQPAESESALSRYLVSPPFAAATPAVAAELKDFFEGRGPCWSDLPVLCRHEHAVGELSELVVITSLEPDFVPRLHKGF